MSKDAETPERAEEKLHKRLAVAYVQATRLHAIGQSESPWSSVHIRLGSDVVALLKARVRTRDVRSGEPTLYGFPVDEAGEGDRIDLVLTVGIP